ncbi:MAG: hypothetical protein F6K36_27210 [Symploca sp. SIO3C6]|nr:hypothetical protein [Symploca sp. SIO3C6]
MMRKCQVRFWRAAALVRESPTLIVAAAQVVAIRGLAAVGRAPRRVNYQLTKLNSVVKMLSEGKFIGIPETKESPSF